MSGGSGSAGRPDPAAGRARRSRVIRIGLMAPAGLALATGLWAGFARLGWTVPQGPALAALHAPLLICGLFTRAAALGLFAVNAFAVVSYWHVLGKPGFEAALGQHVLWGFMITVIAIFGAGAISLDRLSGGRQHH